MASLKKAARKSRVGSASADDYSTDGVLEISVTVGYLGGDVKKEEMGLLERLMQDHCEAGVVALERGDMEQHLHFQMVVRAKVKSARSFGVLVRKYMNWYGQKNMSPAGKVMSKCLTNRLIHTWKGMIGYCLNDSGKEHFEVAMHNISDADVVAGKTLHSIYGKADLKQRVCITNKNIGERAYVWYKFREKRQLTATFLSTLTDMVNSSMFVPAATWIIPFAGQGMDQKRMNCYWKCMTDPVNVTKADVAEVFVNKRQYFRGRYYDEEPDVDPAVGNKDTPVNEYVYEDGAERSTRDKSVLYISRGTRKLPRSLDLPPLTTTFDKSNRVKEEVQGRNIPRKVGRRLFHETEELLRPRKRVTFGPGLLPDFIPLKDRAPLPVNTCLPTTDVILGETRDEMTDADFWDNLSKSRCDVKSTGVQNTTVEKRFILVPDKQSSSAVVGSLEDSNSPEVICLSSDDETEDIAVKTHRKGKAAMEIEPEPILLSSDSEGPSSSGLKSALVYEDRNVSSPPFYKSEDIVKVELNTNLGCDPQKCLYVPYYCEGGC